MVKLKNAWWEGGPKKATKNFFLRFIYAIFNVIRTAKEHTVYISLGVGILMLFLAMWLEDFSAAQRQETKEPLKTMDGLIDDVIGGVNYFTQELPSEATRWINETLKKTEEEIDNIFQTSVLGLTSSINILTGTVEDGVNAAIEWAARQVGTPNRQVTLARFTVDTPSLIGWAPAIPDFPQDALSALNIPEREFSVHRSLAPFIDEVFDVPLLVALYCYIIGSLLVTYAGIRILLALISPFIPWLGFGGVGGKVIKRFLACMKACGKAWYNLFKELFKPWIHVPLVVGIVMTIVCFFLIFTGIEYVEEGLRIPIRETDKMIIKLFEEVNELTDEVPKLLNNWINYAQDEIISEAEYGIREGVEYITGSIDARIDEIEVEVNEFLDIFSIPPINIPIDIDEAILGLDIWDGNFIPRIPKIPTEALRIPLDCCSIEQAMNPWIEDRIREFQEVARVLLIISLIILALPTLKLLAVFIKPFIPKKIKRFFTHPEWGKDDEEQEEDEEKMSKKKKNKDKYKLTELPEASSGETTPVQGSPTKGSPSKLING